MIDSLYASLERLIKPTLYDDNQLSEKNYLVMTLHRPSNVDEMKNLATLLSLINDNVGNRKVIFPMHPRTKKMYDQLGMSYANLIITGPASYLEFIFLIRVLIGT